MPEQVTLEEMEEQGAEPQAVPEPPKLEEIKLEGDNVPEMVRGKTAAEALKAIEAMSTSLQISEAARRAAEAQVTAGTQRQAEPPPPAPVEWDREKFREMYENDPTSAIEQMGNYLADQMRQSFEARLQPLAHGVSSAAETYARQQYAQEFELFGDQIEQFAQSIPDKSVLASKKGWDDLVSYIRGQPQNFDALVTRRQTPAKVEARQQQQAATGFSAAPQPTPIVPAGGVAELDDTTRRIAQTFIDEGVFKSMDEYKRWMSTQGA